MKIEKIKARKILNSRGEETIEIQVNNGKGSAPSGASRGKNEVIAYPKNSVDLAVERFNQFLVPELKNKEFFGFEDFHWVEFVFNNLGGYEFFGGNTLIALEFALLDALSKYLKEPKFLILNEKVKKVITRPLGNVIGGGAHAGFRGPDFQEFLIIPETETFKEAVFVNARFHRKIKYTLMEKDQGFLGSKNDEGAWVSSLKNKELLDLLFEAKTEFELETGYKINLGLDIAASQLWNGSKYVYKKENFALSRDEQIEFMIEISNTYNLYYLEDPLHEEDFEGFYMINREVKTLITGDDLTVTNPERVKKAIEQKSIKAVIVKPNQIGSLLKVKEVIDICKKENIIPVISHRSGETEDNTIAHLAVAWEVPIIKTGIVQGERISKLNELIRIEEYLSEF